MSLLFDNVELLGYTHQNNFFGEKSVFYSSTRTVSIRGYVLDLASTNGVDGIFSSVNQLINQTKDFQDIILNGQNFGRGKVKSFSVDAGNWVRYTQYQADIEVLVEVPIANIDSPEFNSINISDKKFNLIKSFSESFSLNFDNQSKISSGDHSIEIEYDANVKNLNLINLAQSLASELLKTVPSGSNISEGNYLTRSDYKTLNSENYNTVNGKCGFKRSFSYNSLNQNKKYSFVRTHSVNIKEDGIAEVTENCVIKGESDNPSLYDNALIGHDEQMVNIFTRCDNVFQNYKTKFNITQNLNSHFISRGIQINKFAGTISITVVYDNDPKKINSSYIWEYTNSLERSENGIWNVSENGSIRGNGKISSIEKYNNAQNAWLFGIIKIGIAARLSTFYSNQSINGSGLLKELTKNVTKNKYKGEITYSYVHTDDPTVKQTDPDGVKKITIEKSDSGLLPITKDFIIPNSADLYPVNQNRNFLKQGMYSVKVNLEIGCVNNNIDFNSYNYFNRAKSLAGNFNAPGGKDNYLESISYSCDEIEKTITYQANYKYS